MLFFADIFHYFHGLVRLLLHTENAFSDDSDDNISIFGGISLLFYALTIQENLAMYDPPRFRLTLLHL